MFEAMRMLYLYVETPLHAGTGRGLGAIDLPIQRERATSYPIVHAGGLKGCLRAATRDKLKAGEEGTHLAVFGPESNNADAHAGALAPHDGRVLLFPVRSMAGVFAWTTSIDALQRFVRSAELSGTTLDWKLPGPVAANQALVAQNSQLITADKVLLEDYAFTSVRSDVVSTVGEWLAGHALPGGTVYKYWQDQLPLKLCILPDATFCDFVRVLTEVATRVQLDPDKKTVAQGPWAEEYLPVDTLLYAPLLASRARDGSGLSSAQVLEWVTEHTPERLQLGGDETVGRGVVHLRFGEEGGK